MSSRLVWAPTERAARCLPSELKMALRKAGRGHIRSGDPLEFSVDHTDLLRGLAAADVDGAQALLDAVARHGSVQVWEEF